MSINRLLNHWRTEPTIAGNIAAWKTLPARQARFTPFPADLHPELAKALNLRGIQQLYTHQAQAWQMTRQSPAVPSGRHLVVVTGTASGKTLCYNLPVLDHLLTHPAGRALYIFPTKALAQDQLAALQAFWVANPALPPAACSVYDGDTPSRDRAAIRSRARLVITNPDMLHTGILPHHTGWAEFLQNLQYIVIDEIHAYRGVFGSHVSNVLRRLKRVCAFYGAAPQFILTSATIANPVDLAGRLTDASVELIDEDGSSRGQKTFIIYNPPIVNQELGLRRSALHESVRLAEDLAAYAIQTLIFARSRRSVEILLTYLREKMDSSQVRGYRSGYLPAQRRDIEQGLRQGSVRTVVATNALELGIDIGGMGAALMVGYPGSIAAAMQQAGRAGRGDEASLAVLVATADPLDQYLARYPEYLLERSPEQALINPDNVLILLEHIRCAAFELPFQPGEGFGSVPGSRVREYLEFLQEQGVLHPSGERYFWMADQYPAQLISLRSVTASKILLQTHENGQAHTIGEVDRESASWMVHPGAVYLHEAATYLIEELDLEQSVARLRRCETDYYTEPRTETSVELVETREETVAPGAMISHGEIQVHSKLVGFRKIKWFTHEHLGNSEISLPTNTLLTTGYWLTISDETIANLEDQGIWNSARNDYGPEWRRLVETIRARDGYCCQVCGTPEPGRAHDVHHIAPFRSFQSGPGHPAYLLANHPNNLITLCQSCHRRAESAVRVRSGLSGLAYALAHIAPLLLMCDARDVGVHSDPQLPLGDGKPGVALYDRVPDGIGFSQRLFEQHADLIDRTRQLVETCTCSDGCPSCVGPGGEKGAGSKPETIAILKALCRQPLTPETPEMR